MTYSASGPASGMLVESAASNRLPQLQESQANRNTRGKNQRMAALWACLVALAMLACGGVPEGETQLEASPGDIIEPASYLDPALEIPAPEFAQEPEEKLFYYIDYGMEQGGSNLRCNPPWSGGQCAMPSTKTRTYYIHPHDSDGCYGQYWVDLMLQSINAMNAFHTAFDTGYRYVPWTGDPNASPQGQPTLNLQIKCDADFLEGTGRMGQYGPAAHWCQSVPQGQLCRVVDGVLRLAGNNLVNLCIASGATTAQCHKQIGNTIRHELGHEMGLGHSTSGVAAGVLMAGAFSPLIGDPRWNQLIQMTASAPPNNEAALIWGYCPNGNTASCL